MPGHSADPGQPARWEGEPWEDWAEPQETGAEPWDEVSDPYAGPPAGAEALLSALAGTADDEPPGQAGRGAPESLPAGFWDRRDGCGTGFAAGGPCDDLLPGPLLAGLTGQAWAAGLVGATDDELVGLMLAARRTGAWQAALEAAAAGELDARRTAGPTAAAIADPRKAAAAERAEEHVRDELAAALTLTGRSAGILLDLARGLARLPATAAALAAGIIDQPRAAIITGGLAVVGDDLAAAAEAAVLPRAGGMTTGKLRAELTRAILAADPDAAIRRQEKARKDARVESWPEPDGTAALAGRDLDPAAVITAGKYITGLATWLKDHGAEGRMDQLRAAVFTALVNGEPIDTLLPPASRAGAASPGGASTAPGGPAPRGGSVNLVMPLATWLGTSQMPGEETGYGPLDGAAARSLASRLAAAPAARWCITLTDTTGRAVAHGCARAGPGPPGTSRAAWLAKVTITPIETGTCSHQLEVKGYRPSPRLRHLIKIRDRQCSFPGCRRRAVACDDDHTIPYDQGGKTCECNLSPLCRRHHQAKQEQGWHLAQPEPGILTWTLPHGRSYPATPGTYEI